MFKKFNKRVLKIIVERIPHLNAGVICPPFIGANHISYQLSRWLTLSAKVKQVSDAFTGAARQRM